MPTTPLASVSRRILTGRILTAITSAPFVMSAGMKLSGGAQIAAGMAHLGLPPGVVQPLAILEITCLILYLVPRTAVLGAILLTGYLGGAICTHLRVGDDFYIQIALGCMLWLAIGLRDQRLEELMPLRRV